MVTSVLGESSPGNSPPSDTHAEHRSEDRKPSARIVQLDGLRALAFLAVFLVHAFDWPLLWVGVDLFFVLSGYLITGILLRKRDSESYFSQFYYRRFLRIFPPYYLMLLLVFVFLEESWREHWYWYFFYLSNIQDAFVGGGSGYLRIMWSLAVEEQFYLIWPVVVLAAGGKRIASVSLAMILLAPVVRGAFSFTFSTHWAAYELLPSRMDLLAIGAFLAACEFRDPGYLQRRKNWVIPAFAAAGILFAVMALSLPTFRTGANSLSFNTIGYSSLCVMMAAVLVGALTFDSLKAPLSARPLVFLGKISYMAYLSHRTCILVAHQFVDSVWIQGALAFFLTVTWSTASWYFFEKPLLGLKDRYFTTGSSEQIRPANVSE